MEGVSRGNREPCNYYHLRMCSNAFGGRAKFEMFDLIIRNGRVIDGTGNQGALSDLGVVGEKITHFGTIPVETRATVEIDAHGLVVSPGFIDIHTHADIALLARPDHLPKVMQGVTTEVFTNCGLGFAPVTGEGLALQRNYIAGLFGDDNAKKTPQPVDWSWRTVGDFLGRFEAQGIGANIVYLIPHGSIRVSAMGMEERHADANELEQMLSMLKQGMEEGAWGISTGIWYSPMRSAAREELTTLFREAGFYATHQRDYGSKIFEATQESLDIAREAGIPVQIAHLQMNGAGNAGRASEILEMLDRARQSGIDVSCDTYPYTAGSTFIQSLLPAWSVEGGSEKILARLANPDSRAKMIDFIDLHPETGEIRADWDSYQLVGATSKRNRDYEGMSFDKIAAARKLRAPEWVACVLEEEELRACYVHHAAHEGNVRDILRWDGQMIGSDGLHLPGKTHPRLYGTFPRVLGKYVREEGVLSLEQAIQKMTSLPANRLGLKNRGVLKVGNFADIVIFDPKTITDTASYTDPLRFPTGIPYVFANGKAVKFDDVSTGALPGKVLRKQ